MCQVASVVSVRDPMDYSPQDSSIHGDSPGKNAGVGCHALLQGIFPTQDLTCIVMEFSPSFPQYFLGYTGQPYSDGRG